MQLACNIWASRCWATWWMRRSSSKLGAAALNHANDHMRMYEWNIDDTPTGTPRSGSLSSSSCDVTAAAAAAMVSAAEIEDSQADLLMRTQRPSFAGKLLRTCIILAACSAIAALLPQIQVRPCPCGRRCSRI